MTFKKLPSKDYCILEVTRSTIVSERESERQMRERALVGPPLTEEGVHLSRSHGCLDPKVTGG